MFAAQIPQGSRLPPESKRSAPESKGAAPDDASRVSQGDSVAADRIVARLAARLEPAVQAATGDIGRLAADIAQATADALRSPGSVEDAARAVAKYTCERLGEGDEYVGPFAREIQDCWKTGRAEGLGEVEASRRLVLSRAPVADAQAAVRDWLRCTASAAFSREDLPPASARSLHMMRYADALAFHAAAEEAGCTVPDFGTVEREDGLLPDACPFVCAARDIAVRQLHGLVEQAVADHRAAAAARSSGRHAAAAIWERVAALSKVAKLPAEFDRDHKQSAPERKGLSAGDLGRCVVRMVAESEPSPERRDALERQVEQGLREAHGNLAAYLDAHPELREAPGALDADVYAISRDLCKHAGDGDFELEATRQLVPLLPPEWRILAGKARAEPRPAVVRSEAVPVRDERPPEHKAQGGIPPVPAAAQAARPVVTCVLTPQQVDAIVGTGPHDSLKRLRIELLVQVGSAAHQELVSYLTSDDCGAKARALVQAIKPKYDAALTKGAKFAAAVDGFTQATRAVHHAYVDVETHRKFVADRLKSDHGDLERVARYEVAFQTYHLGAIYRELMDCGGDPTHATAPTREVAARLGPEVLDQFAALAPGREGRDAKGASARMEG